MTNQEAIQYIRNAAWLGASNEHRDKIEEAVDAAIEALKAQDAAGDTISRQAAIDIERRATVDTDPEHFESHQKFVEFMDDAEISSFGRWQWSNGFNTALTAVGIDLKRLPSAQPERPKGHWIFDFARNEMTCSECGRTFTGGFDLENADNFCRHCGSDNRGEQDDVSR